MRRALKEHGWLTAAIIVVVVVLAVGAVVWRGNFIQNVVPEAVGIVITVAILDVLLRRRERERLTRHVAARLNDTFNAWAWVQARLFLQACKVNVDPHVEPQGFRALHDRLRGEFAARNANAKLRTACRATCTAHSRT